MPQRAADEDTQETTPARRCDAGRERNWWGRVGLLPSQRFLTEAFALALELGEPIYDCIYLAAAIATECKLVTADARFAKTANRFAASKNRVALLSSFIG
jgi:predicted nucleic acid-binding protein